MIFTALVFAGAVYLSLLISEQFTEISLCRRQVTDRLARQTLLCACLWGLFYYLAHT